MLKQKRVVIQMPNSTLRKACSSKVLVLGGILSHSEVYDPVVTHIVMSSFEVTEITLSALAAGKWILKPSFIYDSSRVGYWLNEVDYELGNHDELGYPQTANTEVIKAPQRCRELVLVKMKPLLSTWNVGIYIEDEDSRSSIRRILNAGGAKVTDIPVPFSWNNSVPAMDWVFAECSKMEQLRIFKSLPIVCVSLDYIKDFLVKDSVPYWGLYKAKYCVHKNSTFLTRACMRSRKDKIPDVNPPDKIPPKMVLNTVPSQLLCEKPARPPHSRKPLQSHNVTTSRHSSSLKKDTKKRVLSCDLEIENNMYPVACNTNNSADYRDSDKLKKTGLKRKFNLITEDSVEPSTFLCDNIDPLFSQLSSEIQTMPGDNVDNECIVLFESIKNNRARDSPVPTFSSINPEDRLTNTCTTPKSSRCYSKHGIQRADSSEPRRTILNMIDSTPSSSKRVLKWSGFQKYQRVCHVVSPSVETWQDFNDARVPRYYYQKKKRHRPDNFTPDKNRNVLHTSKQSPSDEGISDPVICPSLIEPSLNNPSNLHRLRGTEQMPHDYNIIGVVSPVFKTVERNGVKRNCKALFKGTHSSPYFVRNHSSDTEQFVNHKAVNTTVIGTNRHSLSNTEFKHSDKSSSACYSGDVKSDHPDFDCSATKSTTHTCKNYKIKDRNSVNKHNRSHLSRRDSEHITLPCNLETCNNDVVKCNSATLEDVSDMKCRVTYASPAEICEGSKKKSDIHGVHQIGSSFERSKTVAHDGVHNTPSGINVFVTEKVVINTPILNFKDGELKFKKNIVGSVNVCGNSNTICVTNSTADVELKLHSDTIENSAESHICSKKSIDQYLNMMSNSSGCEDQSSVDKMINNGASGECSSVCPSDISAQDPPDYLLICPKENESSNADKMHPDINCESTNQIVEPNKNLNDIQTFDILVKPKYNVSFLDSFLKALYAMQLANSTTTTSKNNCNNDSKDGNCKKLTVPKSSVSVQKHVKSNASIEVSMCGNHSIKSRSRHSNLVSIHKRKVQNTSSVTSKKHTSSSTCHLKVNVLDSCPKNSKNTNNCTSNNISHSEHVLRDDSLICSARNISNINSPLSPSEFLVPDTFNSLSSFIEVKDNNECHHSTNNVGIQCVTVDIKSNSDIKSIGSNILTEGLLTHDEVTNQEVFDSSSMFLENDSSKQCASTPLPDLNISSSAAINDTVTHDDLLPQNILDSMSACFEGDKNLHFDGNSSRQSTVSVSLRNDINDPAGYQVEDSIDYVPVCVNDRVKQLSDNSGLCSEQHSDNTVNTVSPVLIKKHKTSAKVVWKVLQAKFYNSYDSPWLRLGVLPQLPCCNHPTACMEHHGPEKNEATELPPEFNKKLTGLMTTWFWSQAFDYCMCNINRFGYLTANTMRCILNFMLNTDNGLLLEPALMTLKRVLSMHPPCAHGMATYYKNFLLSHVENGAVSVGFLTDVISKLEAELVKGEKDDTKSPPSPPALSPFPSPLSSPISENECNIKSPNECNEEIKTYNDLPSLERLKRVFVVLDFILEVFETDLVVWLVKNSFDYHKAMSKEYTRPLVAIALWGHDNLSIGYSNKICKTIMRLYLKTVSVSSFESQQRLLLRLLSLMAEVVYASEVYTHNRYPYCSTKCKDLGMVFAKEIIAEEWNAEDLSNAVLLVRPAWLRLYICDGILTLLTNRKNEVSLANMKTLVFEVYEAMSTYQDANDPELCTVQNSYQMSGGKVPDSKKGKIKNRRHSKGEALLHVVCRNNCIDELYKLLEDPSVDVNVTDNNGWTALHYAIQYQNIGVLARLLNYRPCPGSINVNPRIASLDGMTPLFKSIMMNQAESCRLLVRYGGKDLLLDKYDGKTAFDMTENPEILKILASAPEVSKFNPSSILLLSQLQRIASLLPIMIQSYLSHHEIVTVEMDLLHIKDTSTISHLSRAKRQVLDFNLLGFKKDLIEMQSLRIMVKEMYEVDKSNPMLNELIFYV